MDNIIIAGKKVILEKPAPEILKSLWLGLLAEFDLYRFAMNGHNLLLLVAKGSISYSPLQRSKIACTIEATLQLPAVFYFDNLPTYERDRLVGRGVYFVVGNRFAFVPTLLANRRLSTDEMPDKLLPSTQHLLLRHLQQQPPLDNLTINEIAKIAPYKYATLAKSIQQLVSLGLAEFNSDGNRHKRLTFTLPKRELWNQSRQYLTNPIKRVVYTDTRLTNGPIGGIEALSHYSMLAGEDVPTRVYTADESKELNHITSSIEDIQRVEIWKYPPIAADGYVDRLSLYLTLRDDTDPRVEKEIETIINNMPW